MLKQDVLNDIRKKRKPVIIYGAGIVGKVLLSVCAEAGIAVKCFCDTSAKVAQSRFCDLDVLSAGGLNDRYPDPVFIISVAAIQDVVGRLRELGYSDWYAAGLLLKDWDVTQVRDGGPIDYCKYAVETCVLCHDGFLDSDRLFFRSVDLIVTERCSLRCKDCSNLMQYYERPKDCGTENLLKSIDAFCAVADEVLEFRMLGGEAFMNKEWPVIARRLLDEPKVRRVVIYTNGTIVPNEKHLPLLQHEKMLLNITDYGPLSRRLGQLKDLLSAHRVAYHVLASPEWLDCAAIMPHDRSPDRKKQTWRDCCAKNMPTLSEGKLYRCPYAANAARLSAVPVNPGDYVDLFERPLDPAGIRELRRKIKSYMVDTVYLGTCDYCNGRPLSGPVVPAAVQAEKPLPYRKYQGGRL